MSESFALFESWDVYSSRVDPHGHPKFAWHTFVEPWQSVHACGDPVPGGALAIRRHPRGGTYLAFWGHGDWRAQQVDPRNHDSGDEDRS